MADYVDSLSDAELRTKLAEFGFPVVPITATTRKVMAKKLKLLIDNRNKITSEGRRSLAKYSSEEESDNDSKAKKDKNRRATIMLPPAAKTRKSISRKVETQNDNAPQSTTITEIKSTRHSTRIIKPTIEADFETGSESETEVEIIEKSSPKKATSYASSPKSQNTSYSSYGLSSPSVRSAASSPDYAPSKATSNYSSSRYTTSTSMYSPNAADNSLDRLNQIRSRLSLTSHDKPTYSTERKILGTTNYGGEGDGPKETPFLSNFTKRLSQLSNNAPAPKTDYTYKNDIIKEHDANGSSFGRSYFTRARNRDYGQDFRSNQETNIFKNSVVSFTLLGIACAFFLVITFLYMGIRTDQPAAGFDSDYVIPACTDNYSSKPGINCLSSSEATEGIDLLKVVLPELKKRSLNYYCSGASEQPFMTDNQIIDHVIKYYAPNDPYQVQKSIDALQILVLKNPKWGISIIHTDDYPADNALLESVEQVLINRKNKNLAMVLLNPDLPWKCIIYNKLYTILSSVLIVAAGFSILYFGQKGYKFVLKQRKLKNDQIYSMVERIIDILQTNATDNNENFLAVNHVRDMLIPPQDRRSMASIWDGAVQFLRQNESRVRTEIQMVSGEEYHVWRWLGSMSASNSPRSKTWQGQAFETQIGSVNSLPCSPTPCLKIRGMFDERERNLFTIREAVLGKCATKCKILHCDVDPNSSCVYLKCANQNEAAVAYQNLHGWWYDTHLITVKYLRLERYMQRFPDSPTKGPPFLLPSTDQSAENDWISNDD